MIGLFSRVVALMPFCLMIGLLSTAKARPLLIRVANYAPYYFKKDDKWTGIELEITQRVLDESNLPHETIDLPWARALNEIKTGKLDFMMALTRKPEREKFIDFIGVNRTEQMILIVHKDNTSLQVKTLDDLTKFSQSFAVQRGVYYPLLSDRIKSDAKFKKSFEVAPSSDNNILKVQSKRVLGFFEDKIFAKYGIANNPKYKDFRAHTFSLGVPQPVWLGASLKLSQEKRDKIRKAHEKLSKEGTIQKIIDKWVK